MEDVINIIEPEIVHGKLIRAREKDYKIVELHRDGTLIFAVTAGDNFLSWGKEKNKINQIALIETVFIFVSLYEKIIKDLEVKPDEIFIRIELSNMHKDQTSNYLAPYTVDHILSSHYAKDAPEDSVIRYVKLQIENIDIRIIAFKIVREIYLWFGFDEDKIPYTKMENDVKMIDPEQIKKL